MLYTSAYTTTGTNVATIMNEAINNKYFFPFKKGPYNSWASYLAGMGRAQKPNIREDKFAMLADLSEVGGRA